MKNKSSNITQFITVLYVILYIGVAVAAMVLLPKYISSDSIIMPVIALAMLGAAVLYIVGHAIYVRVFLKKYNSPDNLVNLVIENNEKLDKAKEDYIKAEKDVFKSKNLIMLYKVLITLYFATILILFTAGLNPNNPLLFVSFAFSIIVGGIYGLPLADFADIRDEAVFNSGSLSRKDYPMLFDAVDNAKNKLNCSEIYAIYPAIRDGISVSAAADGFNIYIDIEEFAILTQNELSQIMLHEIAHVINNDTERSAKLYKFSLKGETPVGALICNLFLGRAQFDFEIKKMVYLQASSKFYEQNADLAVKEFGDTQAYINGTAKGMLFSMYNNYVKPEMSFYIYESEKPPTDLYVQNIALFDKYLAKYGDTWNYILTHRIESRIDTHPTFVKRMEIMGVSSYDITFRETDEAYKREQDKLLKWGCDGLAKNSAESFAQTRKDYYLPSMEKLKQYKSLRENNDAFTSTQKTEYIELLYGIDRDECLKTCEEVLADFPRSAYANFYKGLILASRLDKKCIECLYIAGEENLNFAEYAYNSVGEFACNTGDTELLEKYRERYVDDLRDTLNRQRDAELLQSDKLRENDLPKEDYDQILDFILSQGADIVDKIYSASRGFGKDMRTFYYIETSAKCKADKVSSFFDEVFGYLDRYGDSKDGVYDFALYHRFSDKKKIKMITSVKGSLIYNARGVNNVE